MQTLSQLAERIQADLVGDPQAVVRRAQAFEYAAEGDLTFAADAALRSRVDETAATAIIIAPPAPACDRNFLLTPNPKLAFARAVQALHGRAHEPAGVSPDLVMGVGSSLGGDVSIHPRVTIGANTVIGDRVTLHPGVVIGSRCRVGDDTTIYPNVTVYDDCEIGARVIIHGGTVIGADGFGFVPDENGRQVKLLQLGRVVIEDDCEIGANCSIDRGGFKDTVLRRGVKLDNLIQIGHHCEVGEDTVIAAMSGLSGGVRMGRGCVVAGQVGISHHISLGDHVMVLASTAVIKSAKSGSVLAGHIAQDYKAWRRSEALYRKLPLLAERLRRLEAAAGLDAAEAAASRKKSGE